MKIWAIVLLAISLPLFIAIPIFGVIVFLLGAILLYGWAKRKADKIKKIENERLYMDFRAHQEKMKAEEIAKLESRDPAEVKAEKNREIQSTRFMGSIYGKNGKNRSIIQIHRSGETRKTR